MQLLATRQPAELPTEALLARLRCRRSRIDLAAGKVFEAPPEAILEWVYARLNRRLRKQLAPFLDLLAMRNLILLLRYRLAEESAPATLLQQTLLARPLQDLMSESAKPEAAVARLEAALTADYPFVAGLVATYLGQGPGGVEQQLASGILEYGLKRSGNQVIRRTLRYLVDTRNCLAVRKFWRWQVSLAPPWTCGGSLSLDILKRVWAAHDEDRLAALVTRLSGRSVHSMDVVNLEQGLINGLTRLLRKAGRDPLGLAVIIEYLWRIQLAAHNHWLRNRLAPERDDLFEEVLLL